jgi:uncharacterized protein (DUF608 family)
MTTNAVATLTEHGNKLTGTILKNGAKLLMVKNVSNNKLDEYLAIVLCQNTKGEFVTWLYNAEFESCNHGHYYSDFEQAREDFYSRD